MVITADEGELSFTTALYKCKFSHHLALKMVSNWHLSPFFRTTSRNSNHVLGSRLVLSDTNTPASILHASAFLQTTETTNGSGINIHNLSRPLYRKDIFYSGSVLNVHHDKSDIPLKSYVASITSIPNQVSP